MERKAKLSANGVLKLDGRLILLLGRLLSLRFGLLQEFLLQRFLLFLLRLLCCLGLLCCLSFGLELLPRLNLCLQLGLGLELLPPFGLLGSLLCRGRLGFLLGLLRRLHLLALGFYCCRQLLFLLLDCRLQFPLCFLLDPLQSFRLLGCLFRRGRFRFFLSLDLGVNLFLLLPDRQLDSGLCLRLGQGRSFRLALLPLLGRLQLGFEFLARLLFDPLHCFFLLLPPLLFSLPFLLQPLARGLLRLDPCSFNLLLCFLLRLPHLLHPSLKCLFGLPPNLFFHLLPLGRLLLPPPFLFERCNLLLHEFQFRIRFLFRRRRGRRR
ncbi:hypothetical protein VTK56DRAFT_3232 [Thermocarpiscus australiensis]